MPKMPRDVIDDITRDLAVTWGEMAVYLIKKRVEDLGLDPENVSVEQVGQVIDLLEQKTLPLTMGQERAKSRANLYRKWLYGDALLVS